MIKDHKKQLETNNEQIITEKNNPYIKELFLEISNTKKFITSIQSVSNIILHRINLIKNFIANNVVSIFFNERKWRKGIRR